MEKLSRGVAFIKTSPPIPSNLSFIAAKGSCNPMTVDRAARPTKDWMS